MTTTDPDWFDEILARSQASGWRSRPVPPAEEAAMVRDPCWHGPEGLLPGSLGSSPGWAAVKATVYGSQWQLAGAAAKAARLAKEAERG